MYNDKISKMIWLSIKGKEKYYEILQDCAREKGITKQEIDVLICLEIQSKSVCACDIVSYRNLSKSYVSKAKKALLQKRLIRIEPHKSDKRYQHIVLEPEALSIVDYVKKKRNEYLLKLMEDISLDDLEIFSKVIDQIILNIKKKEGSVDV